MTKKVAILASPTALAGMPPVRRKMRWPTFFSPSRPPSLWVGTQYTPLQLGRHSDPRYNRFRPRVESSPHPRNLLVSPDPPLSGAECGIRQKGKDNRKGGVRRGWAALHKSAVARDVKGADTNVYRTTRLEGKKTSSGDSVHIYEVLWSDLAKPDNTVISFFLSLFQLILHLASLSRLAIDTGAGEGRGWLWVAYRTVQRYAVRLLQIFIPLLEIIMVIALAACLIEVWSVTRGHSWVMIGLSLIGAISLGIAVIARSRRVVMKTRGYGFCALCLRCCWVLGFRSWVGRCGSTTLAKRPLEPMWPPRHCSGSSRPRLPPLDAAKI